MTISGTSLETADPTASCEPLSATWTSSPAIRSGHPFQDLVLYQLFSIGHSHRPKTGLSRNLSKLFLQNILKESKSSKINKSKAFPLTSTACGSPSLLCGVLESSALLTSARSQTHSPCRIPLYCLSDFLLFPRAKSDKRFPGPWSVWCLQEQTALSKTSLDKLDSISAHVHIWED